MKKNIAILVFLIVCMLCISNAYAEKSTLYNFPEFSVRVSDNYLTFTKENVEDVVGSNSILGDLGFFVDYFALDNTIFLDAINLQSFDEICIRCQETSEGMDWRIMNNLDDSYINIAADAIKDHYTQNGLECYSARAYRHPQIVFAVIEGYLAEEQGYTIMYCTTAKINNMFYNIFITGICSTKEKNELLANDLADTVNSLSISGYPEFEFSEADNSHKGYRSQFEVFDGEHFGASFEEVVSHESSIVDVEGSVYEPPAWSKLISRYVTYSKSLSYNNISYLDVDYSSKSFLFDDYDILYSVFYEFRSGYELDLDGQDNINNFVPDYNAVELHLRDLYGNPQYQYKKGTKCDVNGHGMRQAIALLDGLDNERLYDYSEWIIDDPEGKIKIEHIMYFTKYIYKHNVTIEIIR